MSRQPKPPTAEPTLSTQAAAVKMGTLLQGSVPGALLVEHEGSGPLPARSTVVMDEQAIAQVVASRQPLLMLFENGDPRLPIIVGLVQPPPGASLFRDLLSQKPAAGPLRPPSEARVDRKRLVLEAEQEVTLKCGEASITLRRDGKLILRGAYVETTAKGVNRIRGGSVKIN
jgi:hypothetical protein